MFKRLTFTVAAAALLFSSPVLAAAPQPTQKIELGKVMGRWYEVARLPNKMQKGCQGGTSDWTRSAEGFSVVQVCHKGAATGQPTEWKAKARVVDVATNAKIRMSFFGGVVNQEYWVLEHRANEGWLILATPGGNALWLMSKRPSMTTQVKATALSRIGQLGYDVGRLEFPQPARN